MIRLEGVGKQFNGEWLFQEISFSVPAGTSAVLIGPSGHGKSVLLKLIAGLLPYEQGSIQVASEDLGMLFQKNALFDSLTVLENLLFPLKERMNESGPMATQKAKDLLEAVGLVHAADLFPDEISGGMQKRLGIARALIVNPQVILYDEPTAGLDPVTSRTIADLIREMRIKRGSTLLTVTNDMQRAYQIGDQIYLLAKGTLLNGGTPSEVQSTSHPSLRQFIYGLTHGPLTGGGP